MPSSPERRRAYDRAKYVRNREKILARNHLNSVSRFERERFLRSIPPEDLLMEVGYYDTVGGGSLAY